MSAARQKSPPKWQSRRLPFDSAKVDPITQWASLSHDRDILVTADDGVLPYAVNIQLSVDNTSRALVLALGKNGKIPQAYLALNDFAFCTGRVNVDGLAALATSPLVSRFELANPLRVQRRPVRHVETGVVQPIPSRPAVPLASQTLIGIIDTGCPFAHRRLRDAAGSGTRVSAIWDQDMRPDFAKVGSPPASFGYGAALDRSQLGIAMRDATSAGVVDEGACYDRVGYRDVRSARTHGSHVTGLAAGARDHFAFTDPAPAADDNKAQLSDIAFVQLPRDLYHAPSRAALGRAILDGVLWLLEKSAKEQYLIVAIPYGWVVGPHDGSGIVERALEALCKLVNRDKFKKLSMVVAAGNSYEWRGHALLDMLKTGRTAELVWRIPPQSEIPAYLDVWVPRGATVDVTLTPPKGRPSPPAVDKKAFAYPSFDAAVAVVMRSAPPTADGATLTTLRIAPTRSDDGTPTAEPGDWKICLTACAPLLSAVHVYAPRAVGSFGALPRGRQSSLLVPAMTGGGWIVTGDGTLSGLACNSEVKSAGGYRGLASYDPASAPALVLRPAATYTAAGSSRDGVKTGPNFSMETDKSLALIGVRAMGTRSGGTFRMDGSSVAVPQVVRVMTKAPDTTLQELPLPDKRLGTPLTPMSIVPAKGRSASPRGLRKVR